MTKLKDTPLGSPELFNVVIEIPKGLVEKIEYDEDKDEMSEDNFVFKNDFGFINNYGFIPQTRTGDGDTLDAFVLTSKILESGSVILCRPIGVMKQLDRGVVDDKIIAVPANEPERDLTEDEKQQFRDFYAEVARQKNKIIEITGYEGRDQAVEVIKSAMV